MSVYAAVVHKEPGTHYGVTFPDLDGCFTSATTLEGAMIEAEDALALYLEGLWENGEEIPEPMSLEAVQQQARNQGVHALVLGGSSRRSCEEGSYQSSNGSASAR